MIKLLRIAGCAAILAGTAQARAQTSAGGSDVVLHGDVNTPSPGSSETCVQVSIAGEKPSPYSCLNQELQQQAQAASPASPTIPLGATSPSNAVGTFNEQGLKEQYGQNFGKSVIPYRPPALIFNNGLRSP